MRCFNDEIDEAVIEKTGVDKQQIIAMEECSELIKAISKMLRSSEYDPEAVIKNRSNLLEEIADVSICIERLKKIYDISDVAVQKWVVFKELRDAARYGITEVASEQCQD